MVKLPTRGILIENVAHCNIACLSCDRISIKRVQGRAAIWSNMQRVVDAVREIQPEKIYWLKLGEPFLSNTIHFEIDAVLGASPRSQVICSTNGIPMEGKNKIEAAMRMSRIDVRDRKSVV